MRIVPRDANAQADLSTLEERYELVREIGRGATALVYLARERRTGRLVAIKAIRGEFAQDHEVAGRFEREARTAAALDHPNIVRILAVARLEGRALAIVMQYVPGGTLRDALRSRGQLSFEETERVLRDLADALAYAHAHGVVHRDVKPENVFLEEGTGRALLSDFGIARSLESDHQLTMTGSAIGTPTYMSPEQIDGLTVDGRSDLYSLGLVGWEMLAGERPWGKDTLYNVIYKQKHQRLPRLDEIRPGIPPALLFAIEGTLLKRREDRWESAEELLERLSDAQPTRRPTPAPPDEAPQPDAPTIVFRRPTPAGSPTPAPGLTVLPASPPPAPAVATPAAVAAPAPRRRSRLLWVVLIALPILFALGIMLARARAERLGRRAASPPASPPAAPVDSTAVAVSRSGAVGEPTSGPDGRGAAVGTVAASRVEVGRGDAPVAPPTPTPDDAAAPMPPPPRARAPTPTAAAGSAPGDVARRCASPAAADQRACLSARLAERDRELNRVYSQLIAALRRRAGARSGNGNPPEVARLRVEQRAWIAQRDLECQRQGRGREGALWAPVRAACLGEIADFRAQELRERLRGL